MPSLRSILSVLACAGLVAACGEDSATRPAEPAAGSFKTPYADNEVFPVFVSSELVVGENRFLMGLLNEDDAPVGSPDVDVSIAFYDLDASTTTPVSEHEMEFVWMVPGRQGVYVTQTEFADAGEWGAEIDVGGGGFEETVRGHFDVTARGTTPALGDAAPVTDTPTSDDARPSKISTDSDPDPRFYDTSVADALQAGKPFVLTFATPKFCQSAVCGPTLDVVKDVAKGFPGMTFIHVEPYEVDRYPELVPTEVSQKWGLPTEPWVFVVDGRGRIAAKYEGTVSPAELKKAIARL